MCLFISATPFVNLGHQIIPKPDMWHADPPNRSGFLDFLCQTYWKNPELFVKPKMSVPSTFFISCWLEPGSTSNVSSLSFNNSKPRLVFGLYFCVTQP